MAYDGSIKFDTSLDDNGLKSGLSDLSGLAGAAGKGITAAFAAVGAGIGAAVKVGMSFESSMSQVAATMGITTAEIAAGSEEYKILEAAAKKAGATTMFSASQSADALNYLALAGYDAATAADVLPSVLDLAAAGGMDLAYASDLATDAMAALGIEASSENLTHFGDEMAKTAQKSNTSVAQLGEAILVCAGTAKNAGQSLETVNTALGVMANRGIKGSEGGTHLRNVLLSLTAPTDKSAKSLKKLGVEVADSEGNIRDLGDILGDLKKSMSGMSEEARTAALSEIFNKTDISAINALLDAQGDEWNTLKGQVSNADGAMADMAETMNDNLKGKLTILSSSLEGLGIAVYDGIKDPLKDAVDSAIDGISTLSASISDGELQPAIENVGSLIGSLANTLGTVLTGAVEGAINVLSFLGEHINGIVSAVTGLSTAFISFKGFSALTAAAGPVSVSIKELAALMSGRAVAATTTLGKAFVKLATFVVANPYIAAAAAIAGLVAGLGVLVKRHNDAVKATDEYKQSLSGVKDRAYDAKKAYDDLSNSQKEHAKEALDGTGKLQYYKDELLKLVDANGKVKDSDRDRAQFLIGELNNALGAEISMTDGVIGKYQELQSEIDSLIEKKRAEALLSSMQGDYETAINNRTEGVKTLGAAYGKVQEAEAALAEFDNTVTVQTQSQALERLRLVQAVEKSKDAYQEAAEAAAGNSQIIADYEGLAAAATSGSRKEMEDAISQYTAHQLLENDKIAGDTEATLSSIETSIKEMANGAAGALENLDESTYDAAVTALKGLVNEYQAAGGDISALAPIFEAAGISLSDALGEGVSEGAGKTTAAAESNVEAAGEGAKATAQAKGAEAGSAFNEGFAENADSGAATAAAAEGTESAGESAKTTAQAKGQETGAEFDSAEASGIENGGGDVSAAASDVITAAASAAGNTATSEGQGIGKNLAAGIAAGIRAGQSGAVEAARSAVRAAVQAAKSEGDIHSPSRVMRDEVGAMLVEGLRVGITSRIDKVPKAFENLMDDIKLQLEIGAITEADYYKKLETYRDKYFKKGSDKWWDYTKEIVKYENELVKKIADDIKLRYEIGEISEAEYYKRISEYRDEYLTEGTDEWWDYTKEIIKYENRLADEQRDREFKKLSNLKDMRLISERDYYIKLEALRDKYFEKGSEEWENYTEEIAGYYKDVLDNAAAELASNADNIKNKLDSGFSLSHSVTLTLEKQGVEYDQEFDFLNTDIDAYTQELKRWTDVMDRLKERGANGSYMERLFELEPNKAYSLAQQLLKQSDDEFSAYMNSYDEYEKELDRRSKLLYRDEALEVAQAAKDFGDTFVTEFVDSLGDLDMIMANAGYESAKIFADEFISEIKNDLMTVTAVIAGTGEGIYLGGGAAAGGNYQYNTYQFNSSGETVSQQIRAARDAAKIEQLRGGYK